MNNGGGRGYGVHDEAGPGRRSGRVRVARQIEETLRAALAAGRWAAGDKLPSESALAGEFGVGRSSAREAIQSLARDGLLDVRHGTGIFATGVLDGSPSSVADLVRRAHIVEVYQVRRGLEVEAARLAARNADPEALRRASGLLGSRQELVGADTEDFVEADLRFHRAVVAMSGNTLLRNLFEEFVESLRTALFELVDGEPDLPDTRAEHAALLAAIEAGDPDAAALATVSHFDRIIALLRGT